MNGQTDKGISDDALASMIAIVEAPLLLVSGADLAILALNRAARDLVRSDFNPALPASFSDFGAKWALNDFATAFHQCRTSANPDRFETTIRLWPQQRYIRCQANRVPERPEYWLVTLSEQITAPLTHWRGMLDEILDFMPVGVEIYDEDFNACFSNKASDELFIYEGFDLKHFSDWWELGFPDPVERQAAIEEWYQKLDLARQGVITPQVNEWTVACGDGQKRIVQFRFRWIGSYYVVVMWDLTAQRQLQQEFYQLAISDPLTGVWNRRRFFEVGTQEFALSHGAEPFSVLMIDIDYFKSINDRYGHGFGDRVIKSIAERCQAVLRRGDVVARLGGEEFASLLPATGLAEAGAIAERLRQSISGVPLVIDDVAIEISISIGVSCDSPQDSDFSDVLLRADQALYTAKTEGRDRVVQAA